MGRPGQDNTSVTPEAEPQAMTLAERAKEWFTAWEGHHRFPKHDPMAGSDTVPSHIYGEWQMELALYEAAQMLRELVEGRDDTAELVEANAVLRHTLMELRIRYHAAGRRPEECYEMSLIDDALARWKERS